MSVTGLAVRRLPMVALIVGFQIALGASTPGGAAAQDWPGFGWDVGRSSAPDVPMGITADDLGSLRRRQVAIDGTIDASLIYLKDVQVSGSAHDVFFGTTTYGKTIAIDADSGTVLWEFTPPSYDQVAGSRQITTATPVADPDRHAVYAAAPDGIIRKLAVADGRVEWSTAVTRLPRREKIPSALNYFRGRVVVTTGGYIGDRPPYQGHVAIIDASDGRLLHVWNSLCSDRSGVIVPSSCSESGSAIWGRAGAVIDSTTGHIFVATGDGRWDGRTNWGDAVIELDPDATRILGNYTPDDTRRLEDRDVDLGSTAPVLLGNGLIAQGGKDRIIRVIDWSRMQGVEAHRGGEASHVDTPSGDRLFSAPAVLHDDAGTRLFAADRGGTSAWTLDRTDLEPLWRDGRGGTSPVVADGLVFVYDPDGGLRVYEATTGKVVAELDCGGGHWNSPIVADGRIALPEGNANAHATRGVIDIWSVVR